MVVWNKSENNESTPKDRRLLLTTHRSGRSDLGDTDIHDVVVGHLSSLTSRTRHSLERS